MMINVADLTDPNDKNGRTYREINNATSHNYKVGQQVILSSGSVGFIESLTRDCDGTPLYKIVINNGFYSEDSFEVVSDEY